MVMYGCVTGGLLSFNMYCQMPLSVLSLCLSINDFVIYAAMIVGKTDVAIHIPKSHNGMNRISFGLSQLAIEIANVQMNIIKDVKSNM